MHYLGFLALFSSIAITASPMQVQAANYGGFGSTYSEVINPKDSVLNDETAGSEDVKSGLASLSEFKATISTIKADLVRSILYQLTLLHYHCALIYRLKISFFDSPFILTIYSTSYFELTRPKITRLSSHSALKRSSSPQRSDLHSTRYGIPNSVLQFFLMLCHAYSPWTYIEYHIPTELWPILHKLFT